MKPEITSRIISSNIRRLIEEMDSLYNLSTNYYRQNPKYESIKSICKRLESIRSELSLYQVIDKIELAPFNIYSFITNDIQTKTQLKAKYDKSISFSYVDVDGKRTLITNSNKEQYISLFTINHCMPIMSSIFHNIVDNAIKYMPSGSSFDVEVNVYGNTKEYVFKNVGPQVNNSELEAQMKSSVANWGGAIQRWCTHDTRRKEYQQFHESGL